MAEHGIARERYVDLLAHTMELDRARLEGLAEALDPSTFRRIEALRPQPSWRCLEIGAATGSVARWLARRCPAGTTVGTDMSLLHFGPVEEPNLQSIVHDVTIDTFPDESFDFIHARYVFAHLPSRDETLARVVRWLVPGGILMLEEPANFPIEHSPDADYREVTGAINGVLVSRGGSDLHWARTFPRPLAAHGLLEIDLDSELCMVGGARPLTRFYRLGLLQLAEPAAASGRTRIATIHRVAARALESDFHELWCATMAAWGRRPLHRADSDSS